MSNNLCRITAVALPVESELARCYESTHLADAYAIQLPFGSSTRPELLANFIFANPARWVIQLMKVRDVLVSGFGLKTSDQSARAKPDGKARRVGIFRIYNTNAHEIVLGEDDRHLDFRLSVLCTAPPSPLGQHRLTLSTVVHCHNRLGRLYILVIAPFHRAVVKSFLRRAARSGWPNASKASGPLDAERGASGNPA